MPDLPMTVSLNSLPMLILHESAEKKSDSPELYEVQIPYQSVFRPDNNGRNLTGTVHGCMEPFKLGLRGVNQVGKCGITVVHALTTM